MEAHRGHREGLAGVVLRPGEGLDRPSLEVLVNRTSGDPVTLTFGAGDTFQGASVVYARRAGVEATYAVPRSKVRRLLDAVGVP